MRDHRRWGIVVFGVAVTGVCRLMPATAQEADTGSGTTVAYFLSALADFNDALAVETTLAEWTAREQRIIAKRRAGLIDENRAATELYGLAVAYWKKTQYAESQRLLERSIDEAPKSYAAAQSWMLIANTYYGNKADPPRSVAPFEEADRLLQQLIADSDPTDAKSRKELFRARGVVMSRLGFAHLYSKNYEQSYEYYKALVDSPEMSSSVLPIFLLDANRQLADLAAQVGDTEAVEQYTTAVSRLIRSADIEPGMSIMIQLESIRTQWPDLFDERRLAALEEIWNDPRYEGVPELAYIGDALTWPYFFREPMARDEFKRTSERVLKLIRAQIKDAPRTQFTGADNLFVRNLLLAAEFARIENAPEVRQQIIDEFNSVYEGRDIQVGSQMNSSRDHWTRLPAIYRATMTKHFAESQQREKERNRQKLQPEPAPTEAR